MAQKLLYLLAQGLLGIINRIVIGIFIFYFNLFQDIASKHFHFEVFRQFMLGSEPLDERDLSKTTIQQIQKEREKLFTLIRSNEELKKLMNDKINKILDSFKNIESIKNLQSQLNLE